MADFVDPDSGATLIESFLQVSPAGYTDPDAAYDAWCAAAGVSAAGTDYTMTTDPGTDNLVEVEVPVVDGGVYSRFALVHGGGLGLYLRPPATDGGLVTTISSGSLVMGYQRVPTSLPWLTIEATFSTLDYYRTTALKLRKLATGEVIGVFSRTATNGPPFYPIRTAFKVHQGYLEMVCRAVSADIPGGATARLAAIVSSEVASDTTSGTILQDNITATTHWKSIDLLPFRATVAEGVGVAATPGPNARFYPARTDTFNLPESYRIGLVGRAVEALQLAETLPQPAFRPGAVVNDTLRLQEVLQALRRLGGLLHETAGLQDALRAASPRALADGIAVSDTTRAVRALNVIEALRLGDTGLVNTRSRLSVTEAARFLDTVRRFFGADASDGVGLAAAAGPVFARSVTLGDGIGLHDLLGHTLVLKAVAAETVTLDAVAALRMLFRPSLADGVQLSAAYVAPDNSLTTWAVNTATGAVTEYSNFEFSSLSQGFGHKYLGASATGLYELNGETDAGEAVIATLRSGFAQFAGAHVVGFKAAYLGMRAGTGTVILRLLTADGRRYDYQVSPQNMRTTKVNLGKGLRARYFAFELVTTGQDFDLESVEFIPLAAQRRV